VLSHPLAPVASRNDHRPSHAASLTLRLGAYDRSVRRAPDRVERLPQQYFTALLAEVSRHAALDGEPLVDLGRGNPEVGPAQHVIDALAEAANAQEAHGYPPFRGLPALREAIAVRYSQLYGVELDPDTEVTIMPGTKTAICELALVLAERGSTIVLPDPYYPDYPSGPALAAARTGYVPLDRDAGWAPNFSAAPRGDVAAVFLNYPSNPCAVCVPDGAFTAAVRYANETGAVVVHDFA
jgi:L-glutamine---4-(methylsulfanyl)-2-oxobutanoate aminotransferase